MSLRTKILLYLVLMHAILGTVAVVVLRERPGWLLAVEALFLLSIGVGTLLVRALFVPLDLIRTGADLIRERDFASHFTPVGHTEMDELIAIYNRMIDQLREERLRLQEQNLFLDKLLSASPSGVITLDFDGNVAMLNAAAERLLSVTAGASLGRPLEAIDSPVSRLLAAIEVGQARLITVQGRRRLKCRRAEFLDRGFTRSFYLLEELTDELRASEKAAYEKVIRLMSHEVNNSVGSVRSILESCRNYSEQIGAADRDDFTHAHSVAITRMEHLGEFMGSLADVVRLPPPNRTPCDLPALLDDLVTLMRPGLTESDIAIAWSGRDDVPALMLDKSQIEQALLNVLKNAAEAIGDGGTITLTLERSGPGARLSIRDSGPGIAPGDHEQLFTPFFSTKRDGRGLGLTLIQEILTHHGYDFGLINHPEGGAEFWIVFPWDS